MQLPATVIDDLSCEERQRHFSVTRPVYRLRKALYGLQRSAFDWISTIMEHLASCGWVGSSYDPALMTREVNGFEEWIALYVDDVVLSTTDDRWGFCWQEILDKFASSPPEICTDYIGIRFNRFSRDGIRVLQVDMTDYAGAIVDDYEKEWREIRAKAGRSTGPTDLPVSYTPLCAKSMAKIVAERETTKGETADPKSLKRVQGYIGRLMWLARTGRPDICHTVGVLASVVGIWNEHASAS